MDLFVIGGGINGAAVARDAAGRGLKVMLAERDDYASATSSASSKLIHGGLRYLETFEFGLVRESLRERELLLRAAPHLVEPLRFLLPITSGQARPAWQVRLGLRFYDLLAGSSSLPSSGKLSAREIAELPRFRKADLGALLTYWDCRCDDARLVLALLLDARQRGADIANYREVVGVHGIENGYRIAFRENGAAREADARFVVNAAGPWVNAVTGISDDAPPARPLRLVRGSHLVLPLPEPVQQDAYTLQTADGRVVFTIPWLDGRYLVVGTTEYPETGDPIAAHCSDQERDYLLAAYNRYFDSPDGPVGPGDVLFSWSGVRALTDDGHSDSRLVSRRAGIDYARRGTGGFVTLYGGKLTTHRALAEQVLARLARQEPSISGTWTAGQPLYGGTLDRSQLVQAAEGGPGEIAPAIRRRWAFTYGDQIETLFDRILRDSEQAEEVAPGVVEAELAHACEVEDAREAEDFLMRRTKLHYVLAPRDRARVERWFKR